MQEVEVAAETADAATYRKRQYSYSSEIAAEEQAEEEMMEENLEMQEAQATSDPDETEDATSRRL